MYSFTYLYQYELIVSYFIQFVITCYIITYSDAQIMSDVAVGAYSSWLLGPLNVQSLFEHSLFCGTFWTQCVFTLP